MDLKEDLARKTRQSAELSLSLKKSLELIQQQNKALTEQLQDVSNEKDAQIDALSVEKEALSMQLQLQQQLEASKEQGAGQGASQQVQEVREVQAALTQQVQLLQEQLGQTQREKGELAAQFKRQQQQMGQMGDSSSSSPAAQEKLLVAEVELERSKKSAWERYLTITQHEETITRLETQVRVSAELVEKSSLQASGAKVSASPAEQQQIRDLQRQKESLEQQQANLREALQAAEETVFEQGAQLQDQQDQLKRLEGEQKGNGGELSQLHSYTKELQDRLAREDGQLLAETAKGADLQASLDMHIALVSSLKLKLAATQDLASDESSRAQAKQARVVEAEAELTKAAYTARDVKRAQELQAADLKRQLEASEAKGKESVRSLERQEGELREAEKKLAAARDASREEKKSLQEQLLKAASQLREETEEREMHQGQAMAHRGHAIDADDKMNSLREQLDQAGKEAAAFNGRLEDSETQGREALRAVQAEVASRDKDLLSTRAAKASADEELKEQRRKLEAATEALLVRERELKQVGGKLADAERAGKGEAEGLKGRAAVVEGELQQHREALAAQGRALSEVERHKKALGDQLGAKEEEIDTLQRGHTALQSQLQGEKQARKADSDASHSLRLAAVESSQVGVRIR
jgi:chromosome segregation ATPase